MYNELINKYYTPGEEIQKAVSQLHQIFMVYKNERKICTRRTRR